MEVIKTTQERSGDRAAGVKAFLVDRAPLALFP
jgi:hypothetical protein